MNPRTPTPTNTSRFPALRRSLRRLGRQQLGQGMVEYALIVAVVAIGLIASVTVLGGQIDRLYGKANKSLSAPEGAFTPPDTTAPPPPIVTGGPVGGSEGNGPAYTNPTFTVIGDGTEDSFQCSLDDAEFESCSGDVSVGPLSPGTHSFRVRAVKGSATSALTERRWMVTED